MGVMLSMKKLLMTEIYRSENQQTIIFGIFSNFTSFSAMLVPYAIAFLIAKN